MLDQTDPGETLATCRVTAARTRPSMWRSTMGLLARRTVLGVTASIVCLAAPLTLRAQEPVVPIPKPALPGEGRGAQPHAVLSASDAELYRRIFALQADGRVKDADAAIAQVSDRILMGHVLAQRLLAQTQPPADQVATWLKTYGDHPDAAELADLVGRHGDARRARKARPVLTAGEDEGPPDDEAYVSPRARSKAESRKVEILGARIARLARKGDLGQAVKLLESAETKALLDSVELAMARAAIAQSLYYAGDIARAGAEAEAAAAIARTESPVADWIAGLALWRQGKPDFAADHFEAVSRSNKADAWLASAGAFWAARAELLARRPERVTPLLARAAEQGRTFYGLLAARQLGIEDRFNWGLPVLTGENLARLARFDGVRRATALVEAGQHARAEAELALVQARVEPALRKPLLALARRLDLAAAQLRIAGRVMAEGDVYDAALYPIPAWRPAGGFTVDRALLYALMRQESRFDPGARNQSSGAIGLMQLMPDTARHMAGAGAEVKAARFHDPALNLALGQRYVEDLSDALGAKRNLFLLAAAYNAGPGNLARWREALREVDDPLLFIESLPSRQTRGFVARVAASYWIYRMRLGLDVPSLDAAAAGTWPSYSSPADDVRIRLVRN